MNFKPNKDRILVKRHIEKVESDSGIVLGTKEAKNTAFGVVVAVGNDVTKINTDDIVMFNTLHNNYIDIEDEKYLMLIEEDIFGCVDESVDGYKLSGVSNFNIVHPKDIIVKVKTQTNEVVENGIIISAKASAIHDRPTQGVIMKVGSEVSDVNVGDVVEFEKTAGIDLTKDGDYHYVLMDYDRLIGVYN